MELGNNDGFISAQEAIELIKSHTIKDPIVDLKFLAVNSEYIEKSHNFTIRLVKKVGDKVVEDGVITARVRNDRDKYDLIEEIEQAYARNYDMQLNLNDKSTREITTIVDPKTNPKGNPQDDVSGDTMYMPNRNTRIS